jgi:hypothetical protein
MPKFYPVFQRPHLINISSITDEPQIFGQTNLIENRSKRIIREYLFPFFLQNVIDLAPGKMIQRGHNIFNLVKDKLFDRNPAIRHDFFHLFFAVVEVFVQLIDNLLDEGN